MCESSGCSGTNRIVSSMTVSRAMRSGIQVIIVLLAICSLNSSQPLMQSRQSYKGLRGLLPNPQSYAKGFNRVVYYHDQAVAVIDINKNNEMQNCDIIEVYEPNEAMEVLTNLSIISRPTEISFSQMTSLMLRCEVLDAMQPSYTKEKDTPNGALERANLFSTHALNLFAGIAPGRHVNYCYFKMYQYLYDIFFFILGTKWCGTGDVAENYHDLGIDAEVDRCVLIKY
ncbi:hypothetical protein PV327_007978 [Microctonus hyperodae]|uniref:Phospholipase A2-like central domain-containing protein n=1 Tax=Microctonus hyperodae TaxID=165561 RepID=A0AA39G109_MICHY|nr:hypothetical protein PV327_007978 [Microctonus hyperodae]